MMVERPLGGHTPVCDSLPLTALAQSTTEAVILGESFGLPESLLKCLHLSYSLNENGTSLIKSTIQTLWSDRGTEV